MKLTILGAAGARTPLMIEAIVRRQEKMGIDELDLMDIDTDHLSLIYSLALSNSDQFKFKVVTTSDADLALKEADYVITTFRVGGMESRSIDERIPLNLGIIGQETTGPGGFSMALRSLPVLWDYVAKMRRLCPDAWLINFANPAGLMTESLQNVCHWEKSVGICDGPVTPLPVISAILQVPQSELYLDYFGLNHLGWTRAVVYNHRNYLPDLLKMLKSAGGMPGMPIQADLIESLGMLPNEYLYYYYHSKEAVQHFQEAESTRGEYLTRINNQLYHDLAKYQKLGDSERMQSCYQSYLNQRNSTYMSLAINQNETNPLKSFIHESEILEGYTGVALDLIEGLQGGNPHPMILNIPNHGSISGMEEEDVVEIPAFVSHQSIRPLSVGKIPDACLGLMKQIKNFEKETILAVSNHSYSQALQALTLHPLVGDYYLAKQILDQYIEKLSTWYPELK